jgi:hypothetical protein
MTIQAPDNHPHKKVPSMNPSPFLAAALIIASTALTGCLLGNSSGGSLGGISSEAEKVHVSTYSLEGNRIIFPENKTTHYWCNGGEVVIDSITGGPVTLTFDISGKTLSLYGEQDTLNS